MKRTFAIILSLVMLLTTAALPVHATDSSSDDRDEIISLACEVFPEYESAIRWENPTSNTYSRSAQGFDIVHREVREISETESLGIALLSGGNAVLTYTTQYADDIEYSVSTEDIGSVGFYGTASLEVIAGSLYFQLTDVAFTIYEYGSDYFTGYGRVANSNFPDYDLDKESSTSIEYTLYYSTTTGAFIPFAITFKNNKLHATA